MSEMIPSPLVPRFNRVQFSYAAISSLYIVPMLRFPFPRDES